MWIKFKFRLFCHDSRYLSNNQVNIMSSSANKEGEQTLLNLHLELSIFVQQN